MSMSFAESRCRVGGIGKAYCEPVLKSSSSRLRFHVRKVETKISAPAKNIFGCQTLTIRPRYTIPRRSRSLARCKRRARSSVPGRSAWRR